MSGAGPHDVAIIGGGPVGSLAALAFAAQGARVVVLEANPRAATRLAGEWLHPPAVELLARLGVDLSPEAYPTGRGFVVLPDDGSAPIVLSYAEGRRGASLHHERLVAKLRRSIIANDAIEYIEGARATEIGDGGIRYRLASGPEKVVEAKQVVGACGALRCGAPCALGFQAQARTYSRMAGVLLAERHAAARRVPGTSASARPVAILVCTGSRRAKCAPASTCRTRSTSGAIAPRRSTRRTRRRCPRAYAPRSSARCSRATSHGPRTKRGCGAPSAGLASRSSAMPWATHHPVDRDRDDPGVPRCGGPVARTVVRRVPARA